MARRRRQDTTPDFTNIKDFSAPDVPSPDVESKIDGDQRTPEQAHSELSELLDDPANRSDEIQDVLGSPNVSPETLSFVYDRVVPAESPDAPVFDPEKHEDIIYAVLNHPNVPAHLVESHFSRFGVVPQQAVGKVSPEVAQITAERLVDDANVSEHDFKYKHADIFHHLKPQFYFDLLSKRPIPEPETDTMTESQKATNSKVKKIDQLVLKGLSRTRHHDPDTAARFVDFLIGEKPFGMAEGQVNSAINDLSGHPAVPASAVERLYDALSAQFDRDEDRNRYYYADDALSNLVKHPNASPSFIARVALSTADQREAKDAAVSDPRLPSEVRAKLIREQGEGVARSLLENPQLSSEEVTKLYKFDAERAVRHPNAPDDLKRRFYAGIKESGAAVRVVLASVQQLPEDVLLDAVNHKDQKAAIAAVEHPSATPAVVQAGLKRKASAVRQAAMRHPSVANVALMDGLRQGKIDGFEFLQPYNIKALGGKLPSDAAELLDKQYSMKASRQLKDAPQEESQKFWAVKDFLSRNADVPVAIRERQSKDLIDRFVSSDRDDPIRKQVGRSVVRLASNGNAPAQEALLKDPVFAAAAGAPLHASVFDERFLRSAYEAPDNSTKSLTLMAQNPNLPEELFQDMVQKGHLAEAEFAYAGRPGQLGGSYWYSRHGRSTGGSSTILDLRYGKLHAPQREVAFRKILDSGAPGSLHAILYSESAPDNVWRDALQRMTPNDQISVMHRVNVGQLADPATFSEALRGQYNDPERKNDRYYSSPQQAAIGALDPGSSEDAVALEDMLRGYATQRVPHREDDLIKAIPDGFFHGGHEGRLVAAAFDGQDNQKLGALMAMRAAQVAAREGGKDFDRGRNRLLSLMHQGIDVSPQNSVIGARRWFALLNAAQSQQGRYHNDLATTLRRLAGDPAQHPDQLGPLDFLVDMADPEDLGVGEMAMGLGLVSPVKMSEAVSRNPALINGLLTSSASATKRDLLGALIDQGKLDARTLRNIVPKLNSGSFVFKRYGKAFDDAMYNDTSRRVFSVATKLAATDVDAAALAVANTVLRDPQERENKMPETYKKRLVKEFLDLAIHEGTMGSAGFAVAARIVDELSWNAGDKRYIPAGARKELVRLALEERNVDAMIGMMRDSDYAQEIVPAVADAMPTMSDSQLINVAKGFQSVGVAPVVATEMMLQRAGALPEGNYIRSSLETAALEQMRHLFGRRDIAASEHQKFGSAMLDMANRFDSLSPEGKDTLRDAVMSFLESDAVPFDQRVAMFAAMPDQAIYARDMQSMSEPWINAPQVIESAVTPNKVAVIAKQSHLLSSQSFDVMASRVSRMLDAGEATSYVYGYMMVGAAKNDRFSVESAMKVFRQGDRRYRELVLIAMAQVDKISPSTLAAADVVMQSFDDVLNFQGGELDGEMVSRHSPEHIREINSSMSAVKSAIVGMQDHDTNVGAATAERVTEFAERFIGQVAASIGAFADEESFSRVANALDVTLHGAKDSSMGFSTYKNAAAIVEFLASKGTKLARNIIVQHASKFNLTDQQWVDEIVSDPSALYVVANRPSFPAGVVQKVNFSKMFSVDPNFSTVAKHIIEGLPDSDRHASKDIVEAALSADVPSYQLSDVTDAAVKRSPLSFDFDDVVRLGQRLRNVDRASLTSSALESGAGGVKLVESVLGLRAFAGLAPRNTVADVSKSPHLNAKISDKLFDLAISQDAVASLCESLGRNWLAPEEVVDSVASRLLSPSTDLAQRYIDDALVELSQNHNMSFGMFDKIYQRTKGRFGVEFRVGQSFHPAFMNARHGGNLFRKLPVSLPKSLGKMPVDGDSLVTAAEYSPAKVRLSEAMAKIPADGIDWVTFKRANPNMERWPEVKSLFMRYPNQNLTPEHFAEEIRGLSGTEFHVTYTDWTGAQRHRSDQNDSSNLVMQLNVSKSMDEQLASDPKLRAFFRFIQNAANHTDGGRINGHPVTPFIAGWIRIDPWGGKDGWIIEEFQSDFGQRLDREIEKVAERYPIGLKIEGQYMTPAEMRSYNSRISDMIAGWYQAGLGAVEELARRNGARSLYMHGLEVRARLSGFSSDRAYPSYIREMYDKYPRKAGWESVPYDSYPVKSKSFAAYLSGRPNSLCWRKKLK
jgi:hypothetical protein